MGSREAFVGMNLPGSLGGFPLSCSCDWPSEPAAAAAASVSWAVVGRSSSFALSAMLGFVRGFDGCM